MYVLLCFYVLRCHRLTCCADDVRLVLATPESHQVQAAIGYLHQLRPPNDLSSINLRLSRGVHPLQMVGRLVDAIDGTSLVAEHAYCHVPVAWLS